MVRIANKEKSAEPFVINDIGVVELLIEFRYKYDEGSSIGTEGEMFHTFSPKAINQEMISTYIALDRAIKQCDFSEQQLLLIKMVGEGYTHREIAEVVGIENQNVKKALKTVYKAIVKENERQWRRVVYTSTLGLKTKQCTKCEEHLPATNEFYRDDTRSKDGLQSRCRECENRSRKKK